MSASISSISSVVLRRVRTIHLLRSVGVHALVTLGVFVVALIGIGHEVWVARVFENMPSILHIRTFIGFIVGAFLATEFMVQLYVTLALLAFAALLGETIRLILVLLPQKLFFARSTLR